MSDSEYRYKNQYKQSRAERLQEKKMHSSTPEQSKQASSKPIVGEQIDPEIAQLFKFYDVESMFNLVKAQARHIEKLQAKLPALKDEQPRNPRKG